jgi:hypothetical protein
VNARTRWNVAAVNGCPLLAALVGAMAGSGIVSLLALAARIAGGLAGGDIRIRPRGR